MQRQCHSSEARCQSLHTLSPSDMFLSPSSQRFGGSRGKSGESRMLEMDGEWHGVGAGVGGELLMLLDAR